MPWVSSSVREAEDQRLMERETSMKGARERRERLKICSCKKIKKNLQLCLRSRIYSFLQEKGLNS